MLPRKSTRHSTFIDTYNELIARFAHDENARALFNDTAAELLGSFRRKGKSLATEEARAYFVWLLGRKGFNFRDGFWRDVDLPRRQMRHQPAVHLPIDEVNPACDESLSHDPAERAVDGLHLESILSRLDEDQRRLLMRRYVEGHTLRELGAMTNLTPQGVKKRLDKLVATLRLSMAGQDAPSEGVV
jgi:RNA polymerase sigma factor (sigma-70 family)